MSRKARAILTIRRRDTDSARAYVELATEATGEVIWRGETGTDLLAPGMLGLRLVMEGETGFYGP